VKKSIPAQQQNEIEPIELDDGYGSPAAPVISAASSSYKPMYKLPSYKRPPRHHQMKKFRRPKKMFNILDYMPMMNFLMMATSQRKPKRHIGNMPYQSQKGNRHVRMPAFKMPKFKVPKFRMPKPIKYPTTFSHLGSTKKPTGTKLKTNYSPSKSPKSIKLEYSGWQPIGQNTYSPEAPAEAEPEIITIHNAHRHPKKYEVPALPTGTYAPEPITAKPEPKEPKPEVVYGVPEIAVDIQPVELPKKTYYVKEAKTTYYIPPSVLPVTEAPKVKKSISQSIFPQNEIESATDTLIIKELPRKTDAKPLIIKELPKATYPSEEPPAPIQEPLFNSAPVQDLTSLAELNQEYEPQSQTPEPFVYSTPQQPVYTGYSQVYPGSYQATHDSNHLAQEVQSGSVYVQQKAKSFSKKPKAVQQQETEIAEEEDEDLYYIFYDKNKTRQERNNQNQVTPSPVSVSTASFSIFDSSGNSHGFSHSLDHIG